MFGEKIHACEDWFVGKKTSSARVLTSLENNEQGSISSQEREGTRPFESPHKIFLWNAEGVYVDCTFPNPVHGHFFGGAKIRGARLADFFSHTSSDQILDALSETMSRQTRRNVEIAIERQGISYLIHMQLCPMDRHILGWVRDQRVSPSTDLPVPSALPDQRDSCALQLGLLTETEQHVARAFGPGYSNRYIAEALQMSDRTVRFHMSNLLHKLHLPSRAHLAYLRLFARDPFDA